MLQAKQRGKKAREEVETMKKDAEKAAVAGAPEGEEEALTQSDAAAMLQAKQRGEAREEVEAMKKDAEKAVVAKEMAPENEEEAKAQNDVPRCCGEAARQEGARGGGGDEEDAEKAVRRRWRRRSREAKAQSDAAAMLQAKQRGKKAREVEAMKDAEKAAVAGNGAENEEEAGANDAAALQAKQRGKKREEVEAMWRRRKKGGGQGPVVGVRRQGEPAQSPSIGEETT